MLYLLLKRLTILWVFAILYTWMGHIYPGEIWFLAGNPKTQKSVFVEVIVSYDIPENKHFMVPWYDRKCIPWYLDWKWLKPYFWRILFEFSIWCQHILPRIPWYIQFSRLLFVIYIHIYIYTYITIILYYLSLSPIKSQFSLLQAPFSREKKIVDHWIPFYPIKSQ